MKYSQKEAEDLVERALAEHEQKRNASTAAPLAEPKKWSDGIITAGELRVKEFKPIRIILPGLIAEGVTMLAGKPKIGKSWLALDICVAASSDRFVLGDRKPVQGDVLYLALEDNQRRLKKRLDKVLQGAPWSQRLQLHTEWRRLDQGGLEDIREWCASRDKATLIWIDTLAKIRPMPKAGEPPYVADYRAIEGLQKLAGELQVAIVINHHLRKMASEDDPFDEVSGTLGLTGATDANIVIKRHSGAMKIYVQGRDIEFGEFAAELDPNTCRWRLMGEADDYFRSNERQAILTALKEAGEPLSVPEIVIATGRRDRNSTERLYF